MINLGGAQYRQVSFCDNSNPKRQEQCCEGDAFSYATEGKLLCIPTLVL